MKPYISLALRIAALIMLAALTAGAEDAWTRIQRTGELPWGADPNGGAPYVFYDKTDPTRLIGFEVEIMDVLCRRMGVRSRVVVIPWDQLVPALLRGDCDAVFNGLEVTDERESIIDFSIPYYIFSEQITVRRGDRRFSTFEGLRGRRVGTLSATLAQRMMEDAGSIAVVPYPSPVEAYKDLEIGRLDAVLQDLPIAAWYVPQYPALENVGTPVGRALYAAAVRADSPELLARLNRAIDESIRSGELEKIYRKWDLWTAHQKDLHSLARSSGGAAAAGSSITPFLPLLLKGAGMTVILAVLSMALAIAAGFALVIGRLYGGKAVKALCAGYVELIRGTPLLIQLYLIYYGLPNVGIQLNAFVAAFIGMGLNYAAYESEIYRAGILSVPRGQTEAALSLGMSVRQTFRFVILPQAARTILPPSTNDFIALFKDTSLVSIITVTELTRAYSQAATTTYRFLELGLLTALLYLLMSIPLSLLSRRLERKHHVHLHHG